MKITDREKRDWSLLIFIVPVGIFLMVIAGQIAVRIVPSWSVNAGMQSSLNLESAPKQHVDLIQPILPDILTPLSWFGTFLTPGAKSSDNVVYPPFIVFEATSTPSPASIAATTTETAVNTMTVTESSPTNSVTTSAATSTKRPKSGGGTAMPPPALCTDSTANNLGSPLPCTYPSPPAVCTDPAANNVGNPLPCTYYVPVSSTPVGTPVSIPAGITVGTPDGTLGTLLDGSYIVMDLSSNPIIVNGPSDKNYDFVYYEQAAGPGILMDRVILSISTALAGTYYQVLNWGDGTPDTNSNIGNVVTSTPYQELDNQPIDASKLYGATPLQTGVLVDVDNAASHPPVGSYSFLAIQAPPPPTPPSTPDPGNDGSVGIDSVQVIEVSPTP